MFNDIAKAGVTNPMGENPKIRYDEFEFNSHICMKNITGHPNILHTYMTIKFKLIVIRQYIRMIGLSVFGIDIVNFRVVSAFKADRKSSLTAWYLIDEILGVSSISVLFLYQWCKTLEVIHIMNNRHCWR